MTGDDVINYKEKKVGQSFKTNNKSGKKSVGTSTSKHRSGGGPVSTTAPPSKPQKENSPTKKSRGAEDRSKSKTSDNLSVSQLQSEHQ